MPGADKGSFCHKRGGILTGGLSGVKEGGGGRVTKQFGSISQNKEKSRANRWGGRGQQDDN